MHNLRGVMLLAGLACLPCLAFADSIFDIEAKISTQNGVTVGTFSNTVNMNATNGRIVGWNVATQNSTTVGGAGAVSVTPSNYLGKASLAGFAGGTCGFGYLARRVLNGRRLPER